MNSPAPASSFDDVTVSKHRLETLNDGVFAVVLTLLVIDLKLENLGHRPNEVEMWHELRHLMPQFFGYVVTFALTCGFWFQHHALLHMLRHATRRAYWLNALFLFTVTLLPFSVSTFMKAPAYLPGALVYFGNLTLLPLALAAGWRHAKSAGLLMAEANPEVVRRFTLQSRAFVLGGVAGLAMSFIEPAFAGLVYPLPILAFRIYQRRRAAHS